jgi:hypothetical protein|nr:MAG TPA: hypothetical protein [Bacteriophage sp.]
MRIISQDGTIDVPYEMVVIQRFRNAIYFLNRNLTGVENLVSDIKLADYSTEEKAIKAMKMLREQYSRIEIIKALASGTCEHMEESLKPKEFKDILKKYINMEVFQFPKDDEIEV